MQNTTTPLIDQLKTPEPTDSKKLSESLNGRWLDNYFNLKGFKLYQLNLKDLSFPENKEIWLTSFLYCILMDRFYDRKYFMMKSKSLRFSCTLMNILLPYFFLFHSKIIYHNYIKMK